MVRKLFVIDASSIIYRSFYAVPRLQNSKGLPTNAISGYCNILLKLKNKYKPDYFCVVFDAAKKSFRNEIYKDYKATRQKMPEELAEQIPYIKKVTQLWGIHSLENEGFEADDLIATISQKFNNEIEVNIVTSDKDLSQLINKDSSDTANPGTVVIDEVKDRRIGIKEVIERFGLEPSRLKHLLALMGDASDNIPGIPGVGEKTAAKLLQEFQNLDNLSANLGALKNERLRNLIQQHTDLLKTSLKLVELKSDIPVNISIEALDWKDGIHNTEFESLLRELGFLGLLQKLGASTSTNLPAANLTSLKETKWENIEGSAPSNTAFYAICHNNSFFISTDNVFAKVDLDLLIELLKKNTQKFIFNCDTFYDISGILESASNELIDLRIACFLLYPDDKLETIEDAFRFLSGDQLIPSVTDHINALITIKKATWDKLNGLQAHMKQIEMPVSRILYKMSGHGMLINVDELNKMSAELEISLERLKKQAFREAGCEFNLDSPKQLQEVLYKRIGLKPTKKTKTGFSTDVFALQELTGLHPLPNTLLEYRTLSKLKSGFVESLLKKTDPKTNRIHAKFNQIGSSTGRIITSEPNLQNIPVRGEIASKIRSCFTAPEGSNLIMADYSQIELRILAHMSKDKTLVNAFKTREDIHTLTAAEIFGTTVTLITPEMRRKAKEVNFSIIYGITPHGLSLRLKINRETAKKYIELYFKKYEGVKSYIEQSLKTARETGFVTTILNRKRIINGIDSKNKTIREHAERVAVNTPIQGSASDILKLALIKLDKALAEYKTNIIMQIHDEILIEAPLRDINQLKGEVKLSMETAYKLDVPLEVNIKTAQRWE
ncbi:MAG: DNA polymerase I [Planctomycetes bacterium]|nr:DNA polymerase I [Planctomycetota bacterium]